MAQRTGPRLRRPWLTMSEAGTAAAWAWGITSARSAAQEIYKEAFNSAWDEYADASDRRGDDSREEVAHKVAWSAVKNDYEKDSEGRWKRKSD